MKRAMKQQNHFFFLNKKTLPSPPRPTHTIAKQPLPPSPTMTKPSSKPSLQHSRRKQVTEDQNNFEHKPNIHIHIHNITPSPTMAIFHGQTTPSKPPL